MRSRSKPSSSVSWAIRRAVTRSGLEPSRSWGIGFRRSAPTSYSRSATKPLGSMARQGSRSSFWPLGLPSLLRIFSWCRSPWMRNEPPIEARSSENRLSALSTSPEGKGPEPPSKVFLSLPKPSPHRSAVGNGWLTGAGFQRFRITPTAMDVACSSSSMLSRVSPGSKRSMSIAPRSVSESKRRAMPSPSKILSASISLSISGLGTPSLRTAGLPSCRRAGAT